MIKSNEMKRMLRAAVAIWLLMFVFGVGAWAMSTTPEKVREESASKPVSKFDLPPADSDWPTFHGNNYRTGFSSEKFIKPPLQVRWGFATGGNIWSSPAVVAGTLFVGSSDGKLYSLDVTNGNVRWIFKTNNAIYSSPAVSKGTVFFGSSDSNLYAADADTGAQKWYFETGDPVTSSPAVDGDSVIFGSWDGYLYNLATGSGSLKWKFKTDGAVYSSAAINATKVYFGSSDGRVYALDKVKGTSIWAFQTEDYVSATPAVFGKMAYFGSWDGNMYAVNSEDGKLVWKFRTDGGIYSSAAVYEDNVYFGSYDGKVYCLDRWKGTLKWSYLSKDSVYHSSPVIANGVLYIGLGYKNKIQAFNATTGEYLWSYTMGASVGSTPAISETNMYVAASDGKIYAFGDTMTPTANVEALKAAYNINNFKVKWSGEDKGGSGVKSYDIQFRTNSGDPWQNWLTNTTTTFATFGPTAPVMIKDNTVYYFQARSRDNAGNIGIYAGGDGDTYTVVDTTAPRINKVSFNNAVVDSGSFIQSKPLIQASISDNVAVDIESLKITIDGKVYSPDSYANGLLKFKVQNPLDPGQHTVKIQAIDIAGNNATPWQGSGLRVSEGIEAADISSFPVPFNPIAGPAYVSYRLNANAETTIFIYDKLGSLVYSLKFTEGQNGAKRGWNKVVWNGITGSNNIVGNGEYTFKIVANRNLVGKGQIVVQK